MSEKKPNVNHNDNKTAVQHFHGEFALSSNKPDVSKPYPSDLKPSDTPKKDVDK